MQCVSVRSRTIGEIGGRTQQHRIDEKRKEKTTKNRSAKTTSGTKDRTRKLVSKLYTSFGFRFLHIFVIDWRVDLVSELQFVRVSVGIQITFFFSVVDSCSALSFFVFDDDPFHCVYIGLPSRLKFINDHTPCSLEKKKKKTYKSHQIKFVSCVCVFFFCRSHQIIIIVTYYIMWMDVRTWMLSGEQSFVVLSVCWWIFNKLSSAFFFSAAIVSGWQ